MAVWECSFKGAALKAESQTWASKGRSREGEREGVALAREARKRLAARAKR